MSYNNNFEVTPGKLCRGGPYMWQGNSKKAKMCRRMAESKEGKKQINRYQCPSGFSGMPLNNWSYTPVSGPGWQNQRCEDSKNQQLCDPSRNGIF